MSDTSIIIGRTVIYKNEEYVVSNVFKRKSGRPQIELVANGNKVLMSYENFYRLQRMQGCSVDRVYVRCDSCLVEPKVGCCYCLKIRKAKARQRFLAFKERQTKVR